MKKLIQLILCLTIIGVSIPFSIHAFDYVLGTGVYTKSSQSKPAKGSCITDPNFHTEVCRVTDKTIDGYDADLMVPYYGRFNPENADDTRLLLGPEWQYYLYDANSPYTMIRKINPIKLGFLHAWSGGAIEAQWDATDPNIFYYILGSFGGSTGEIDPSDLATFNKYNIATDTRTIIHDFKNEFPTATLVNVSTEGEPSADQRYWSWMVYNSAGTPIEQIVYDKTADSIIHKIDNPPCGIDWITTSPDGNYTMANHMGCNNWYGQVYPWSSWPNHSSISLQQHSDTAYFYTPGVGKEQAHFGIDSAYDCMGVEDYNPNGYRLRLISICGGSGPYCPSVEVSASNFDKPGWGATRFYQAKGGGDWYDYQIVMFELNKNKCRYKQQAGGSWSACSEPERIWRIAHTHDTGADSGGGGYWAYWASINRKGTKLYFGSNWDTPGGQVETYVVNLPSTWYQDLMGGDTTPPAAPTGVAVR